MVIYLVEVLLEIDRMWPPLLGYPVWLCWTCCCVSHDVGGERSRSLFVSKNSSSNRRREVAMNAGTGIATVPAPVTGATTVAVVGGGSSGLPSSTTVGGQNDGETMEGERSRSVRPS